MTLYEYANTGDDTYFTYDNVYWAGQSFTVGTVSTNENFNLTSIKVKIGKGVASTPGTITALIYIASSNLPTGSILSTGTTDGNTLTTNTATGEWREITMSSVLLNASTQYVIVLKSAAEWFFWRVNETGSIYAGGCGSYTDTGVWYVDPDSTQLFEVYGTSTATGSVEGIVYTKIEIKGTSYDTANQIKIDKSMNDFNSTSSFSAEFSNYSGRYNNTFNLNDEVKIYAELNVNPPTTQIFLGIIEDIKFRGREKDETIIISGRDYGAILQDIIVSPRIFKNQEVSLIVKTLMIQNAAGRGITTNNVNATTTTIDKITFNNISLFDAINRLAGIAGFYFYIDVNKDLHFEKRNSLSSGFTFNNTNVLEADFTKTDDDIFNNIIVYGDRQLTGAREDFGVITGSVYTLDDKPYNVRVIGSGVAGNTTLQPGGILNVNDPEDENVQWLVDFQTSQIILTSGITGGYNTGWAGSKMIIEYDRSSPLVSIKSDLTSQTSYGKKDKIIIDRNIKDLNEAIIRATTTLAESKDIVIQGNLKISGIVNVTPGNTVVVDVPFHNINNQTYSILSASYIFNKTTNLSNNVLSVTLNKKVRDFIDYMKEQELRLRNLEGAEADTSITNVETATGSPGVEVSAYNVISRSIGSGFYFHVPLHNVFDSTKSLLGDVRAGSTVISYP